MKEMKIQEMLEANGGSRILNDDSFTTSLDNAAKSWKRSKPARHTIKEYGMGAGSIGGGIYDGVSGAMTANPAAIDRGATKIGVGIDRIKKAYHSYND